jgi:multidrug efflux pump subunit AcrA (membrane-fusion protein)
VARNPEAFDLKAVKTGKSNGGFVAVAEGLREGDRIVVLGAEKLPRK